MKELYSLPIDLFGGPRAAFAISLLTASAGAAALCSPYFGRHIDLRGYCPVTPLAACALLRVKRTVA